MKASSEVQPTLILKKESLCEFLIFVLLFTSYLNTVLRLDPESDMTLFRLLLPISCIFFLFLFKRMMVSFSVIAFIFLLYGLSNSILISSFGKFNIAYFFHYVVLIFLGGLTFAVINRFGVQTVFKHLRFVYIIMIVLAIFQFFYAYEFPNTFYRQTLNIYYWVENDFSAVLASFIPFLLVSPDKKITNRILAFLGLVIIVYNDSRIALLSVVFFVIFKLLSRFSWVGYVTSALGVIFIFILFHDYELGGNTLYQLLVDPFGHIFTLTPYPQYGSVYDRTNALIFGIKELINTWGFGVGPGNVNEIFKRPEYFLQTAQSMHNFVAQIVVEYGWLMIVMLIYSLVKSYNLRRRLGIAVKEDKLLYVYFVTMALASLSQSEGLFSNYYFFITVFTSIAYFGNTNVEEDKSSHSNDLANHVEPSQN